MSTYYVPPVGFRRWLKTASFSNVSKNKVRKDLWSELEPLVEFKDPGNFFNICATDFIAIQTFCMVDGRGENLSKDEILNFATSINHLLKRVLEFEEDLQHVANAPVAAPVVHP
jgi:hypothetical protein